MTDEQILSMLTRSDAQEALLRQWIRSGKLPVERTDGAMIYYAEDLEDLLKLDDEARALWAHAETFPEAAGH